MLVPILHCSVFVHYIVRIRGTALIMMTINPIFAIMIVMMMMMLLVMVIMIISVNERGNAGTNHRSSAVWKGTRSPNIFHT